jgi:uncharacterized protein
MSTATPHPNPSASAREELGAREIHESVQRIDAHSPDGRTLPLLGILSQPCTQGSSGTAVLIVVGGPQYRVGSHRQFVHLARHLARAGHPVLRFDLPGMGDSPGEAGDFEDSAPFIAAAVSALHQQPGVQRVVLWGLCDGASASLLYVQATGDRRVAGLALLNPWLRSKDSLARTELKHYYRQRLAQASFWRKLLQGGVGLSALREFGQKLGHVARRTTAARQAAAVTDKQAPFQDRMAQGWMGFPGPILLLLSGRDLTAQAFVEHARSSPAWSGWHRRHGMATHTFAQADHTLSDRVSAQEMECLLATWLQTLG